MAESVQAPRSVHRIRGFRTARRRGKSDDEQCRLIIDAIASGVVVHDRTGAIVEANAAAVALLGLPFDQLLGRRSIDVRWHAVHEDGSPFPGETHPAMVALRTGQAVTNVVMGIYAQGGTPRWLLVNAAPVCDSSTGQVQQAVATFVDITDRHLLEGELAAALAQYRSLVEHVPVATYTALLNATGSALYISPQIATTLGYQPSEFEQNSDLWFERVYHADRDRVLAALAASRTHGTPFDMEYRLVARDGQIRWFHDLADVVRGASGQPEYLQGVMLDVTVRKGAEEEQARLLAQLDAERAWLRTVIARTPVGVVLAEGPNGERITANKRANELFGREIPPDALARADYAEQIVHPDGRPFVFDERPLVRALRGQAVTGEEALVRQPTGRELAVLISTGPIHDRSGAIIGAVSALEDITRLKDLERLREEWTSVVVHDLRQPVTLIAGYAFRLQRQIERHAPAEEMVRSVEFIRTAARSMERMIADLLDVSRIEARRLTLAKRWIDLPSLVQDVVSRLQPITVGHPVKVEVVETLPPVEADPVRIEQVLTNLLSNAVKYGDSGTEITVRVGWSDGEEDVAVTNVGPGIRPEEIPTLFSRFYRTRSAQGGHQEGLGLGLYISHGIVEAHGGRIWVVSTPGRTTTFSFSLPLPRTEQS